MQYVYCGGDCLLGFCTLSPSGSLTKRVSHFNLNGMRHTFFIFILILTVGVPKIAFGDLDTDNDGLPDSMEQSIYKTAVDNKDSDGDGYSDGDEVHFLFDPNLAGNDRILKEIKVNLKTQVLEYYLGSYLVGSFKVSTGKKGFRTPKGEFVVEKKRPFVTYKGPGYFYPNTKWNLKFKDGSWGDYYIHGAYWRKTFGYPGSHGCVNVSYANMEQLYNWADEGTKVVIF